MMTTPIDELHEALLIRTCRNDFTSLFYRNLLARVCTLYFVCLEGILTASPTSRASMPCQTPCWVLRP